MSILTSNQIAARLASLQTKHDELGRAVLGLLDEMRKQIAEARRLAARLDKLEGSSKSERMARRLEEDARIAGKPEPLDIIDDQPRKPAKRKRR